MSTRDAPIRIAQVVGHMQGGGIESVVMNYYRHIDRGKVQFDFIANDDSTMVPREEIEGLGGTVTIVPRYSRLARCQRAMEDVFEAGDWRIVHSHINTLSVFPLYAAKKAGVPVRIAHSHATAGPGEPARNAAKALLKRWSTAFPTHLMACSDHAGKWLFGADADFDVLKNAIDLDDFAYKPDVRSAERQRLGIAEDACVVGHVGRFAATKNQLFIVEVFQELLEEVGNARLVLAGDGSKRDQVEETVRQKGLGDRVTFLGQCSDVSRAYQLMDVFVMPSLYEGFGMVAVEAQRTGLPCILSERISEAADIADNVVHVSLDAGAAAWAQSVVRILRSSGPRATVGGPKMEEYDIVKQAKWLEAYYLGLVQ